MTYLKQYTEDYIWLCQICGQACGPNMDCDVYGDGSLHIHYTESTSSMSFCIEHYREFKKKQDIASLTHCKESLKSCN